MSYMQQASKKIGLNTLISWGASVVIIGLTFKLLHWSGGEWMIAIGLLVEACLFFLLGYAALSDRNGQSLTGVQEQETVAGTRKLDDVLSSSIDTATLDRLKQGFEQFTKTVESVNHVAGTAGITQQMLTETQKATAEIQNLGQNLAAINNIYTSTGSVQTTQQMIQEIQQATTEIQQLRKNIAELNNAYKAQLEAFRKA